jgi:hypothetical protein
MKTQSLLIFLIIIAVSLSACTVNPATNKISETTIPVPIQTVTVVYPDLNIELPKIDRHPSAYIQPLTKLNFIPSYHPDRTDNWQVDLRGKDLSNLDLKSKESDLFYADFDSRTIWPKPNMLPDAFDIQQILKLGMNPGMGIHQLHTQGITGRGVGIGIIDQTLLVDHKEYGSQLRLYEELDDIQGGWMMTQMHGPAVASIAVGKTVGVAPESDLYYIATGNCHRSLNEPMDFSCIARGIRRILEINQALPEENKIRVISIANGWSEGVSGYEEVTSAVEEAKNAGLFIICSSVENIHGFKFHGLGRSPLSDPDSFESYEPGIWWANQYYEGQRFTDRLLVPMDSRTTASPSGIDEYVFYRSGGWSWSIPYIAGVYALAVQVDSTITPNRFWETALETGEFIQLQYHEETFAFGPIINPVALITALK